MFCNNCGKEIPDGTKFCNNCGASQDATPVQQATSQKKGNNTVKIVIIAAVVVVCFVIGAFVIAPSFSKGNDDAGASSNVSSQAQNNSQNANTESTNDTQSKADTLTAIPGGINTGKAFLSDMGEYGKVSLSVGYNQDNGVIRQVSAAFTITVRHSEYASMKSDFDVWEERISNSGDKNVEASYVELSESVSFIISIKELNEADRAQRVALAEEILDFVSNESDCAFYVDDITSLLVDTYGFEVVE